MLRLKMMLGSWSGRERAIAAALRVGIDETASASGSSTLADSSAVAPWAMKNAHKASVVSTIPFRSRLLAAAAMYL